MFKKVSRLLLMPVMLSAFSMASCTGESGADGIQGEAGTSCGVVTDGAPEGSDFGIKCGEEEVQWVMNGEKGLPGEGCVTITENVPAFYDVGVKCGELEVVWVALNSGFNAAYLGITPGATKAKLGFNWYSEDGLNATVALFDADGTLISTTGGTSTAGILGKSHHKVTVEGLTANTEYQYSVSNNGKDWSKRYTFKTAADGNLKFALTGDTQLTRGKQDVNSALAGYKDSTTSSGWAEVIAEMEEENVAFIVSAGDQVDRNNNDQGTEDEYVGLFAPVQMKSIPFAPVRGNHERTSSLFDQHYNLPNQVAGSAPYEVKANNYYFLYNRVLFVGLNTSYYPEDSASAVPFIADYKATLQAAKASHSGAYDWLVVWHHKSTASLSGHVNDYDIHSYVLAGFQKLMTSEEVDIVFAGHDHVYVRSVPMTGDRPNSTENPGHKTTYFTVNTGSGLKYYPPQPWGTERTDYPYHSQEVAKDASMSAGFSNGSENCGAATGTYYGPQELCADVAIGDIVYLPESVAEYSQTRKPGWSIIEASPTTFTIDSYELKTSTPIDHFVITK